MRRVHLAVCLLSALAAGCKYQTVTPLPKTIPAAGMLVRCDHERLNLYFQMRHYKLLASDRISIGNRSAPMRPCATSSALTYTNCRPTSWTPLRIASCAVSRPLSSLNGDLSSMSWAAIAAAKVSIWL